MLAGYANSQNHYNTVFTQDVHARPSHIHGRCGRLVHRCRMLCQLLPASPLSHAAHQRRTTLVGRSQCPRRVGLHTASQLQSVGHLDRRHLRHVLSDTGTNIMQQYGPACTPAWCPGPCWRCLQHPPATGQRAPPPSPGTAGRRRHGCRAMPAEPHGADWLLAGAETGKGGTQGSHCQSPLCPRVRRAVSAAHFLHRGLCFLAAFAAVWGRLLRCFPRAPWQRQQQCPAWCAAHAAFL